MKRRRYFAVLAVFAGTFLVSCGSENNSGSTLQSVETQEVQLQSGADEGAEELTQIGPTVMIDGVLYYDTGEEDAEGGQCGTMDGYITSSVSADQLPTKDDQSNFGDGYGYQLGRESGTYEIYMNGRWVIFSEDGGE